MPTPIKALRRIATCKKKKKDTLDLSGLNLTEIPIELADLVWLLKLRLHNNQITEIKGLQTLQKLTTLYLHNNQIVEIEGLQTLQKLTTLYLHNNQIIKIEGLQTLQNLTTLYLSDNQIAEIKGLQTLQNLTVLYLSNNQIAEVKGLEVLQSLTTLILSFNPIVEIKGLQTLQNLNTLALSFTQITEIKGLQTLQNLNTLNLSDNQITEIKDLETLRSLTTLSLHRNQIAEIEGLETLQNLTELNLSSNQITEIKGLQTLQNLTTLYLSDNQIADIKGLQTLQKLTRLSLHNNQIAEIKGLQTFQNLTILNLSFNQITELKGLQTLQKLIKLNLSDNQITELKDLETLQNLTELNLSNNQIAEIKDLQTLKHLNTLQIHNNPFVETYQLSLDEAYDANHLSIIQNLLQREKEQERVKVVLPAKMLLLGNHACGKSSLLNYIQQDNLSFTSGSTHVLKIEPYPLHTSSLPRALFFDFGGQDYYHGIYRVFLSASAGNILLFAPKNNRNETISDSNGVPTQNFGLGYWLGQKKLFHPQSPLILVQTYATNKVPAEYATVGAVEGFRWFAHVSLADGPDSPKNNHKALELLKAQIEEIIAEKQIERDEPVWYENFLKEIYKNHTQSHSNKKTDINELLPFYTPTALPESERLTSLKTELEQLSNQGLILYYPAINADEVWLNPEAFTRYVYEEILTKKIMEMNGGRVPAHVFKTFDANVLKILEQQKVLFLHAYTQDGQPEYIIPNFLPLAENDQHYPWFTFGIGNPSFVLKFQDFIPMGIINQLICWFGRLPDQKVFWRNQLVFTFMGTHKVLIRLDLVTLELYVYISPTEKSQAILTYLFYCVMSFYWDLDVFNFSEFQGSNVPKEGRDPDHLTKTEAKRTYINQLYTNPERRPADLWVSLDNTNFVAYSSLYEQSPDETQIRASVIDQKRVITSKTRTIALKPFEMFTNRKFESMKKVFISYSKDDLALVNRFRDAIIPLYEEGIIENPWYCTFLEAGSDWNKEIQQQLRESDIVFFMCSMSFLRTKYIRDHEIKVAIDSGKTVIPVILNFCDWQPYLGAYNALPYTSKPIVDFKNQDLAWLLTTKGIRWSLEKDPSKKQELDKQTRQLYERLVVGKLDDNAA